jgi:hypothetical protein
MWALTLAKPRLLRLAPLRHSTSPKRARKPFACRLLGLME